MDDAMDVRLVQGSTGLGDDSHDVRRWKRANATQQPVQRLPRHELHDQVDHAMGVPEVVNLHNVRIAQRGHRSRLSPKPLDEGGVTGPGVQQNLDRDVPVENDIAAPPNLAHATAADQFAQYVPIVQY